MHALAVPILIYHLLIMGTFCAFGVHRLWLAWAFRRSGGLRTRDATTDPSADAALPVVTVQLPMYNEGAVAERLIDAAARFDYPRDRLEIQVLDDSTDDSIDATRACCARWRTAGVDITWRHRTDRRGYKAGALGDGLADARGAFIAIFDADFVPPPGLLRDLLDGFTAPDVGLVQARWTHLNRDASMLTQLQAAALDAHFVIEQTVRSRTGRWFNFNGTAGLWRRDAIDAAGGWTDDTLTEDTDLSYRAQAAGWRFRFLPHVTCPAELPTSMSALRSQQHRWTKGLLQSACKLTPLLLRRSIGWRIRLEGFLHLLSPLPALAILGLTIIAAVATALPAWTWSAIWPVTTEAALTVSAACLALGTGGAAVYLIAAQRALGASWRRALGVVPGVMALGIGLSLVNSLAILEAIAGRRSPFVRTPKVGSGSDALPASRRTTISCAGMFEAALAVITAAVAIFATRHPVTLVGAPFLLFFAAGWALVAVLRLAPGRRTMPADVPDVRPTH